MIKTKPDVLADAQLDDLTTIARRALIGSVRIAELTERHELAHLIRTTLVALDDVRDAL